MITCTPISEFLARPRVPFLLKRLIPAEGTGVIFGEPGSGKTFFASDLGLHLSHAENWRDRKIKAPVGVVYLAAEGQAGFADRVRAYLDYHELAPDDLRFEVITSPVNLLHGGEELQELITAIRDASERIGPVRLIVVDTLARTTPGGDENSGADMGAFLSVVARIGKAIGAFMLVIHHCGKDATRGARGWSGLKGAVDLEIEVTKTEASGHVAAILKARDFPEGERFGFRLEAVDLGLDDDGDLITSCVVIPTDAPPKAERKARELSGVGKVALQALTEHIATAGEDMPQTSAFPPGVRAVRISSWREAFRFRYGKDDDATPSAFRHAFRRAREALQARGLIAVAGEYVWLVKA